MESPLLGQLRQLVQMTAEERMEWERTADRALVQPADWIRARLIEVAKRKLPESSEPS